MRQWERHSSGQESRMSKHIEVRYHFIREQVQKGLIQLTHVNTRERLADVLSRAVDGEMYKGCLEGFGIVIVPTLDEKRCIPFCSSVWSSCVIVREINHLLQYLNNVQFEKECWMSNWICRFGATTRSQEPNGVLPLTTANVVWHDAYLRFESHLVDYTVLIH